MLFKMYLRPKIKSASVQIQLNSIYSIELHVLTYFRSLYCPFPCIDDAILHKYPTNAPIYVSTTLYTLNNPICFTLKRPSSGSTDAVSEKRKQNGVQMYISD